jgi:hypothetical protein
MKSSLKQKTMSIQKLMFDLPGKIAIKMEDGRLLIIPLKYFPELKKLSVEKRKKYTIVDDRSIFFEYSNNIYHLEDFIGLEEKWKER